MAHACKVHIFSCFIICKVLHIQILIFFFKLNSKHISCLYLSPAICFDILHNKRPQTNFSYFLLLGRAIGIPEMLRILDVKLHVDSRISNFLVPVGATLERMGSCLFICLSALFMVQLEGMPLGVSNILLIG